MDEWRLSSFSTPTSIATRKDRVLTTRGMRTVMRHLLVGIPRQTAVSSLSARILTEVANCKAHEFSKLHHNEKQAILTSATRKWSLRPSHKKPIMNYLGRIEWTSEKERNSSPDFPPALAWSTIPQDITRMPVDSLKCSLRMPQSQLQTESQEQYLDQHLILSIPGTPVMDSSSNGKLQTSLKVIIKRQD